MRTLELAFWTGMALQVGNMRGRSTGVPTSRLMAEDLGRTLPPASPDRQAAAEVLALLEDTELETAFAAGIVAASRTVGLQGRFHVEGDYSEAVVAEARAIAENWQESPGVVADVEAVLADVVAASGQGLTAAMA